MLKVTVQSSLEKAYDFIDNRLVLLMAEKKIRVSETLPKILMIDRKNIKQNVQNTVFYLEKEPKRGTMVVIPTENKGDKIIQYACGMALREKNSDEFELYIDLFSEAVKKGILSREQIGSRSKIILIIIVIALIMSMFLLFPIFVLACITTIILYPIKYLIEKNRFKHKQKIMNSIVSIFEAEFSTNNKLDTKDWINFWGRVKSGAKELVIQ